MKISEVIYELAKIQYGSGMDLDVSVEDGYLVVHEPDHSQQDSDGNPFVKTWTLQIISPVLPIPVG